jgi:hypothetical protein
MSTPIDPIDVVIVGAHLITFGLLLWLMFRRDPE